MRRCMLSKSQAQFRGECCLPVPRESVACSRTLYLSTCPTGRNQVVKGQATLVATVPSRRFASRVCRRMTHLVFRSTTCRVHAKKTHTSKTSMALIESFFPDRVVSKGRWPPRSPDLSPPDFFLWCMLKGTVYGNKPRTLAALEDNIRREIGLVTATTCSVALKHVCMPTAVTSSTLL